MQDTKYLQMLLMLMNAITQKELDNNHKLLWAFRKCQNNLGFHPHKTTINITDYKLTDQDYFFSLLNPEE